MSHKKYKSDYGHFKRKILRQALIMGSAAVVITSVFYTHFWHQKGGDLVVSILENIFRIDLEQAHSFYQQFFRNNILIVWIVSIAIVFLILLTFFLTKITRYFDEINQGIDALLNYSDTEISLPPEMIAVEKKINTVRRTLIKRTEEVQLAEQRKNQLVMYLAHDIRTPLTSIIGYLNLLEEALDISIDKRAKYVQISLDKAYRLETLINQFFEITRYNSQQIKLNKSDIDLYYMLVQIIDEFYPVLSTKGNTTTLDAVENITIYGDSIELARVFNNLLKNAVNYSTPNTEITISVQKKDSMIIITFKNSGKTIPKEKLSEIFDKFYRLDENRGSDTGGSGLGLSIAKEIITLHDGTILAESEDDTVTFIVALPYKIGIVV